MFESTVHNLLEIPSLPIVLEELRQHLQVEAERRVEFRAWLTEDTKAEFINGAVVMHTPASHDHNESAGQLYRIASLYADIQQLGKVLIEKAMIGLSRNDYEPDVAFWRKEVSDTFEPRMSVYPRPDLVVEVLSPGRENTLRDTRIKLEDYAAHGIPEYWIIDPKKKTVEKYLLSDTEMGKYALQKIAELEDTIESTVLTGFTIPVRAIFEVEANAKAVRAIVSTNPSL
jgi:Uma2 family endonuclease